MVNTFQPSARSRSVCSRSRRLFRRIFGSQYARFDFGLRRPSAHLEHPCQKQPWTNTQLRRRTKTRSGFPGSDGTWSRYRNPAECKYRRTRSSGFVSSPRIRDITSERFALLRKSGMVQRQVKWVCDGPEGNGDHLSYYHLWHPAIHCANQSQAKSPASRPRAIKLPEALQRQASILARIVPQDACDPAPSLSG